MALRRLSRCLLVVLAITACKDKGAAKGAGGLDQRCEQMAKACGDTDKHVEKLSTECKDVAKKQTEKTCTDKATAAYDCFEKELCGKGDKIWALDDLRVLATRKSKCVAEQKAAAECAGPGK